ncbi:hypothetical protein ACFLYO_09225 [Chloroflexota bacterium]
MYAEDRVLVGVINRKKDLDQARFSHWYRIPRGRAAKGIHAEYMAFYLSRAFGQENGGIRYYARRTGHELARRRDLLPNEADHKRANNLYYKIQMGELREKIPPILNPTRRPVVFIHTTWDRFIAAQQIGDLYSTADHFVDRVFYALHQAGIPSVRIWEAEQTSDDGGSQLTIQCQQGELVATTSLKHHDRVHLTTQPTGEPINPEAIQAIIGDIRQRIADLGGLLTAPIPLEHGG